MERTSCTNSILSQTSWHISSIIPPIAGSKHYFPLYARRGLAAHTRSPYFEQLRFGLLAGLVMCLWLLGLCLFEQDLRLFVWDQLLRDTVGPLR